MNLLNKNKNESILVEKQIISVNFLNFNSEKKDNPVNPKIKETKQKIVAIVIVLFMFLMVATSLEIKHAIAANTDVTNLLQNIVAGTLDMESAPTVGFADITAGTAQNSIGNLTVVNVRDYRGTGAGWTVSAVCTNFLNGTGGNTQITNARIQIQPGDFYAYNGASNTDVAKGAVANFDASRTVLNTALAAGRGQGAYNLFNSNIQFTVLATDPIGTYNATMTFTVI